MYISGLNGGRIIRIFSDQDERGMGRILKGEVMERIVVEKAE